MKGGNKEDDRMGKERMALVGEPVRKKASLGNNKDEDDIDLKARVCMCVHVCASVSRDCPSVIHCNCE